MPLVDEKAVVTPPPFKFFSTLREGYVWANNEIVCKGVPVIPSKIWCDWFKKPRSRMVKVLGVEPKAQRIVNQIAPGGQWSVVVEQTHNGPYQCSAWYNRFAPYAYSMCQMEEGFKCLGLDGESLNSIFKSFMGYVDLGAGAFETKDYKRIVDEDTDLFAEIYSSSMRIHSPGLPFEEAFWPCAVFLAVRAPKLFLRQFGNRYYADGAYFRHAIEVMEDRNIPIPETVAKRAKRLR